MQLLAKELVARKLIVAISRETIRNKLNQIELQPWKTERFCIPEVNIAETELSVLSQQCLARRISRADLLKSELAAWQQERNQEHAKVKWQFTTADARIKLHHLYPQF
jgi:hypothetical protein